MVRPDLVAGAVAPRRRRRSPTAASAGAWPSSTTRIVEPSDPLTSRSHPRTDSHAHSSPKRSPPSSARRSSSSTPSSTSPRSARSSRSATASPASTASTRRMAGEMLEFENGVRGQVFNLEEDSIGAIIFGDYQGPRRRATTVTRTGALLEVPVGDGADRPRGRSARPPDRRQGPDPAAETTRPVEMIAPGIAERQPVKEPLQTGIKAIDAMIPIGRGQRELIIGDRKTGKTAIAIDTIINQKAEDVDLRLRRDRPEGIDRRGRRRGPAQARGAMDYTIVVVASAAAPGAAAVHRPLRRLRDGRVLHVQAASATRCASTTTCPSRPPPTASSRCCCAARRAARRTPATCSTCHSRLLERAAKLSQRDRRRLADRAADHRDAGRRGLGVHPDQRDLDHRRPDLPGARPVLRRRAPRRSTSASRSRASAATPDQGDEDKRSPAPCASTSPPSASSRPSRSSAPSSTRPRRRSSTAAAAWSSC